MSNLSLDALLLDYAAGRLSAAEELVVVTLLAINPDARRKVSQFEALGGRVIEEENPADVCSSCLESVLEKIGMARTPAPRLEKHPCTAGIPEPLYSIIQACASIEAEAWARRAAGIETLRLRVCASADYKLYLMKLAPAQATPRHSHARPEITLVLEGDYRDAFGHYKKGDIAIIDGTSILHSPVAGGDGCVCLILTDGPLRFAQPVQRFLNVFFRV